MNNKRYRKIILSLLVLSALCLTACGESIPKSVEKKLNEPESSNEPDRGIPPGKMNFAGFGSGIGSGTEYTALRRLSLDDEIVGEVITSTGTDENALLVEAGNIKINGAEVNRESSISTGGDNASFYGVGATVLCTGGHLEIEDTKINGNANGAAGVFAYGNGIVGISNSEIHTSQGASGGIHAAGGGTVYANDVTAVTEGQSSAAIRSDRGGGLIVAERGSYTSNGVGSPAVYSTANICVRDAELKATSSEAVCIEGKNALYLYNCSISGAMQDNKQNECTWNVILYQSMSGDAQIGSSTFQMDGGVLRAANGGMFYTTNTASSFLLKNVDLVPAENSPFLLRCTGNKNERGWGQSGANGADCNFTAISQKMNGSVQWDSISTLSLYLTEGSTWEGAFILDESCAGNGGDGYADLYIDESSVWIVTGSSRLSHLYCAGSMKDRNGRSVSVVSEDGKVFFDGDSEYAVTVDEFDNFADVSGAEKPTAFEDAQVNNGGTDAGFPPEMPEGGFNGQQPPEMPEGGFNGQQPPEMPEGGFNGQPPEMPEMNRQ